MRIPYVIDNIAYRLGDVLNDLLRREQGQQVNVATAYFSIRGFAQLRDTLPSVRRFRLLLGDKPLEGEDIGLRPDSAACLRHELNADSSTNDVQVLIETVRELYEHQGAFSSNGADDKKPVSRIKREDLQLICYEYIYA